VLDSGTEVNNPGIDPLRKIPPVAIGGTGGRDDRNPVAAVKKVQPVVTKPVPITPAPTEMKKKKKLKVDVCHFPTCF
jgi:hypothetical protein